MHIAHCELRTDGVHDMLKVALALSAGDERGRTTHETLSCDICHDHIDLSTFDAGGEEYGIADAYRCLEL
jgi:hypothetical protein